VIRLRRRLGWILLGFSGLLCALTIGAFTLRPDFLAAFTVVPVWLWGGIGILGAVISYRLRRERSALIAAVVWLVTIGCVADESRSLLRFPSEASMPGPAMPYHGKSVIRVATLNCSSFRFGNPAAELAAWQPDIVLLQEVFPYQVQQIATALGGPKNEWRVNLTNAVITRWKIEREINDPNRRKQQVSIATPSGKKIEVVNVHLATAATDLRLWRMAVWVGHRANRATHRQELSQDFQQLRNTTQFPATPTVFGGDFNSTASDGIHRQLAGDFVDAFAAVGTGLGNTFQRRLPFMRIDYLYGSRELTPVRCRTVTTRHSDHRMVIADFLLK
jgi:endonuclease/exonuclease/phosphatase (EEP) superfamily protein YafD